MFVDTRAENVHTLQKEFSIFYKRKFDMLKFGIFGSHDFAFINFYFKIYKRKFDILKFDIFGSHDFPIIKINKKS